MVTLETRSGTTGEPLLLALEPPAVEGMYIAQVRITPSDGYEPINLPVQVTVVQSLERVYLPAMRR